MVRLLIWDTIVLIMTSLLWAKKAPATPVLPMELLVLH